MEVIKTEEFLRAFAKLPKEIQQLYQIQENRFRKNWRDPRLHIKSIHKLSEALAFRVTRRYRVFFYFQNETGAVFFEIDHRKDIYK